MLGAHVSGFPSLLVDVLLTKYADHYLATMTAEHRTEVAATRREVHQAALLWQARSEVGATEPPAVEVRASSEWLSTAQAATLLGVSTRRVRTLAAVWESTGAAYKAGAWWLVDRDACLVYADTRERSA